MAFLLSFFLFMLKLSMLFVPEHKYEHKVKSIVGMDEKNKGFDLKGWEYRRIASSDGKFIHRYYYYPSSKPDAPFFLLFHGLNLDGRTFLNLKSLSDTYQLIAYDLPEQTDRYQGNFDDFMGIINEFVTRMDIHTCCLCGVSFGGSIALRLAASHPDLQAQGLVLASTAIIGVSKREKRERLRMAQWVRKQPDYKLYWFMEKVFNRSAHEYTDADSGRSIVDILRVKHPDFYRQVGMSMGTYDASIDAKKVRCPVLCIMGDKDRLFSRRQIDRFRQYIPQAEFETVTGGTHAMVFTRGEEIAKRIKAFCLRHPLPAQNDSL